MADPEPDPPAPTGDKTTEQRLDGLEDTQREQGGILQRIEDTLAKLVPGHAQAQENVEKRLDRPSTVEEQVKAELERAKREEAERQAREAREADDKQLRETVAKLTEKPPEPPVRRATKLLGWGS